MSARLATCQASQNTEPAFLAVHDFTDDFEHVKINLSSTVKPKSERASVASGTLLRTTSEHGIVVLVIGLQLTHKVGSNAAKKL